MLQYQLWWLQVPTSIRSFNTTHTQEDKNGENSILQYLNTKCCMITIIYVPPNAKLDVY